jgi:hypothetical protein
MSCHEAPPPRPSMPSVHFLDFSDRINPVVDRPDREQVLWHLNVGKPPMKRTRIEGDDGSSESSSYEPPEGPWRGMLEGDIVVFPSAAPPDVGFKWNIFESVRFVGQESAVLVARDGEAWHEVVVPLMSAGFSFPEFPSLVVSYAEHRGMTLRELYEGPFDAVTSYRTGGRTLHEAFADNGAPNGAYEMFWSNAKMARRRGPPGGDPWKFSLGDCVWISTVEYEYDDASSSKAGRGCAAAAASDPKLGGGL